MSAELNPSLDMDLVPCEPRKYIHVEWAILRWGFSAYRLINHGWLVVSALEDFAIKPHSPRTWSLLVTGNTALLDQSLEQCSHGQGTGNFFLTYVIYKPKIGLGWTLKQ